ncbi:Two-component system response regulator DccR [hydrothermal vent metagenome]|uniref:Two-component system response regulator DccR n=1 Tax=hydrothermal vent metagenome TaxID=652676 RepID=A0A3B1DTX5_9ZZZZ
MIKILYLEDDISLSETITEFLSDNGFEVTSTYNSLDTLEELYNKNFDLLVLDVNVPGIDGFELLKKLRDAEILIPTIFTTSFNTIEDLDRGYSLGADDYLKKPFVLKELLHRINAICKRSFHSHKSIIQLTKDVSFNIETNILKKHDENKKLTQKELELLKLLIKNKNLQVNLETIYRTVWTTHETSSDTSLRVYVNKLRKILGKESIVNIKKQGYMLVI